jgi:hypothetical protein
MKHLCAVICGLLIGAPAALARAPISLDGTITAETLEALQARIERLRASGETHFLLRLNSTGGDVIAALATAEYLRQLNELGIAVDTRVDEECSSACILLFVEGRVREARYGAIFLFHQLKVQGRLPLERLEELKEQYTALYVAAIAEVDRELAEFLLSRRVFSHERKSMTLSGGDILRWGYQFVNSTP